jgi:lysophospholipase L1-like esterase
MDLVDSLMRVACKRYKDVYYVKTTNATSPDHYTSVDGTHPGDYGYTLWARSVKKPVLRILRKYGIK